MNSLDFDLKDTTTSVRDMVRQFAAATIAPRAAKIDETNTFPRDLWPQLGQLGLLGITVGESYGGAGMGPAWAMKSMSLPWRRSPAHLLLLALAMEHTPIYALTKST